MTIPQEIKHIVEFLHNGKFEKQEIESLWMSYFVTLNDDDYNYVSIVLKAMKKLGMVK